MPPRAILHVVLAGWQLRFGYSASIQSAVHLQPALDLQVVGEPAGSNDPSADAVHDTRIGSASQRLLRRESDEQMDGKDLLQSRQLVPVQPSAPTAGTSSLCPVDCNAAGFYCDSACTYVYLDYKQNGGKRCDDVPGLVYISSASQCEAAATGVGVCDSTARDQDSAGNPRGCWFGAGGGCAFASTTGSLNYNSHAAGGESSPGRNAGRQSLCAVQAAPGWVLGGDASSCTTACGSLECTPGEFANHNNEVDTNAKMESVMLALGFTCNDFDTKYGLYQGVPGGISSDGVCLLTASGRAESTIDCTYPSQSGKRRLCWCSVPTADTDTAMANSGALSGNFVRVGDYVELPEGGGTNGAIEFSIACAQTSETTFSAEVWCPDGKGDSFEVQVGSEAAVAWHLIREEGGLPKGSWFTAYWNMAALNASQGDNIVLFKGREDGVKVRNFQVHGGCTFVEATHTNTNTMQAKETHPETQTVQTTYEVMQDGDSGCPSGMDIETADECWAAVSQLGFDYGNKGWVGSIRKIPRFCSVKDSVAPHFNSASTGSSRGNQAPVCKAAGSSKTEINSCFIPREYQFPSVAVAGECLFESKADANALPGEEGCYWSDESVGSVGSVGALVGNPTTQAMDKCKQWAACQALHCYSGKCYARQSTGWLDIPVADKDLIEAYIKKTGNACSSDGVEQTVGDPTPNVALIKDGDADQDAVEDAIEDAKDEEADADDNAPAAAAGGEAEAEAKGNEAQANAAADGGIEGGKEVLGPPAVTQDPVEGDVASESGASKEKKTGEWSMGSKICSVICTFSLCGMAYYQVKAHRANKESNEIDTVDDDLDLQKEVENEQQPETEEQPELENDDMDEMMRMQEIQQLQVDQQQQADQQQQEKEDLQDLQQRPPAEPPAG